MAPETAIGLMSGTSLDGIDAAVLETDGVRVTGFGPTLTAPYESGLRERIRAVLGARGAVDDVARAVTEAHAGIVNQLLAENGLAPGDIRVVGFHGHTIDHRPQDGVTVQIGDGALLARLTGIEVVCDFRAADVAAGGEGAPFAPLYHRALCEEMDRPVAVLNIGGIANVTWIGANEDDIVAFDTGPGNTLMDEWVRFHTGQRFDAGGALAATGTVDTAIVDACLAHPYFTRPPPKSLDRLDFDTAPVTGLSPADGAATLAELTCRAVARACDHLPAAPGRWLVTGGGRHNATLMKRLADMLGVPVMPVEAVGWNGDALEAQAFAFLAVRALKGLPLSLPGTTGVAQPMPGGRVFAA